MNILYYTGSGRIQLDIPEEILSVCSHPGDCYSNIQYVRQNNSFIENQLQEIDSDDLRKELSEYGAWTEEQLESHDENLNRILWLACGDLMESSNDYTNTDD